MEALGLALAQRLSMRSTPLLCLALPLLAACGDSETIRLRKQGDDLLFTTPSVSLFGSAATHHLRVCGLNDPLPRAVDDETSLCALVDVDAAALAARGSKVVLKLEGSAVVPAGVPGQAASFEPGAGHAPEVLSAWVTTGCFGPPSTQTAVQQVRGELRLEQHDADRWRGRLELHMEGEPGGSECSVGAEGADFEVELDVAPEVS